MKETETLGDHVERYLLTKHNQHTQRWYAKYLQPMAVFISSERDIGTITRRDAEEY